MMINNTLKLLFGAAFLISSCTSDSDQKTCQYEAETLVDMQIIRIEPGSGDELDVVIQLNKGSLASQEQNLADLRELATGERPVIDSAYIKANHLYEGLTLSGTITDLKQGQSTSCRQVFLSFDQRLD